MVSADNNGNSTFSIFFAKVIDEFDCPFDDLEEGATDTIEFIINHLKQHVYLKDFIEICCAMYKVCDYNNHMDVYVKVLTDMDYVLDFDTALVL